MPSIYDLKPRFQRLLRPATERMVAWGLRANQVTVAAALLSLLAGAAIAAWPQSRWPFLMLPLVLSMRMGLNAIDGMMAREHGMKTPLGAILNELGDVFSDLVLYAPWALVPNVNGALVGLFLVLLVAAEMAGTIAPQIGASRRYDGPMGKSDRAFVIGTLGLVIGGGVAPGGWLDVLWTILCILAFTTMVNRARAALREVTS